ncbi:hypothetical protein C1646_822048 [Rhizophagus diaphanus]|nr:hypothetical protein C1646_822048 [Rhizophagus diaphanus] [Rhizophagus sp. MUCL 43196]
MSLFRDIEANSEKFEIRVLTSETIDKLEDRVFAKLKEKKGDTFTDIEAYNLNLWKVNIPNDNEKKFSTLVLKNDDKGDIKILRGVISDYCDYWEEQPPNECTHVIIDSPYLTTLRKLKALTTGDPGENEENYQLRRKYSININCLLTDKSNRSQNNDIKTEEELGREEDKRSGCYIYEMIDAEIIFLGDELRIDKKYRGMHDVKLAEGC